jgi:hypothetical protein
MYGDEISSLRYYHVLLNNIENPLDEEMQLKQVEIFKEWIIISENDILNMNKDGFKDNIIKHSDQVYIDIGKILQIAKYCDVRNIFKHLLLILSKANPQSNAKDKLKEICNDKKANSENFIKDLVHDITNTMDVKDQDPSNVDIGSVLNNIINSGAMTKIFSSVHDAMTSGDIDLGELIKSTQNAIK